MKKYMLAFVVAITLILTSASFVLANGDESHPAEEEHNEVIATEPGRREQLPAFLGGIVVGVITGGIGARFFFKKNAS